MNNTAQGGSFLDSLMGKPGTEFYDSPMFLLGTSMLQNAGYMRNDPGFAGRMGNALGGWRQALSQRTQQRLKERQLEYAENEMKYKERRRKLEDQYADEIADAIEARGQKVSGSEELPFPYLMGSKAARMGDTAQAMNMMQALQPKPTRPEAYTLSPGQTRYLGDKPIASVPAAEPSLTGMERNIQTLVKNGVPRDVAIKLEAGAYKTTKDITGLPIVIDLIDNKPVGRVNMRGEWEPAEGQKEKPFADRLREYVPK